MTDKEKLEALLTEFGVPFKIDGRGSVFVGGWMNEDSPKVDGYVGFYTCFLFTGDGKFVAMGAWE